MNDHQTLLLAYINAHLTTDSEILATGSVIHETNVDFVSRLVTQIVHIGQGANQLDYIKVNMFAADMPYCATQQTDEGEVVEYDIQLRIYKGNGRYILLKPEYYSTDKTTVYFKIEKTATDLRGELLANLCVTEPSDVTDNGDGTYTINTEVKAMYSQLMTLIIDEVAQASKEYQSADPNMDARVLALEANAAKAGGVYKPDYITIDREQDGSDETYKLYTTGILQDKPYKIQLTKEESMTKNVGYYLQYSSEGEEGNYFALYVDSEKEGLHIDAFTPFGLFGNIMTSDKYPIQFGGGDGYLQIGNIPGDTEGTTTSNGMLYIKDYDKYETQKPDDEKTWKERFQNYEVVNVGYLATEIKTVNDRIDNLDFSNIQWVPNSIYDETLATDTDLDMFYNKIAYVTSDDNYESDVVGLYTVDKAGDTYYKKNLSVNNFIVSTEVPEPDTVKDYDKNKIVCVKNEDTDAYDMYKLIDNKYAKLGGSGGGEGLKFVEISMADFSNTKLTTLDKNTVYILKYKTPINSSWDPYTAGYAYNTTAYHISSYSFNIYINGFDYAGQNPMDVNGIFVLNGHTYDVVYRRTCDQTTIYDAASCGYIRDMTLKSHLIHAPYDFISYSSIWPSNAQAPYEIDSRLDMLYNIDIRTQTPCAVCLYSNYGETYYIKNIYIGENCSRIYFNTIVEMFNICVSNYSRSIYVNSSTIYNIQFMNLCQGIEIISSTCYYLLFKKCFNIHIQKDTNFIYSVKNYTSIYSCNFCNCTYLYLYGIMYDNTFNTCKMANMADIVMSNISFYMTLGSGCKVLRLINRCTVSNVYDSDINYGPDAVSTSVNLSGVLDKKNNKCTIGGMTTSSSIYSNTNNAYLTYDISSMGEYNFDNATISSGSIAYSYNGTSVLDKDVTTKSLSISSDKKTLKVTFTFLASVNDSGILVTANLASVSFTVNNIVKTGYNKNVKMNRCRFNDITDSQIYVTTAQSVSNTYDQFYNYISKSTIMTTDSNYFTYFNAVNQKHQITSQQYCLFFNGTKKWS